jgi:glycosyltransferase involved in cell wall biosynthesis
MSCPQPGIFRHDRPRGDSRLNFGFIGRLEESKGIDLLVQAAASPDCTNICWHIFGSGSREPEVRAAQGRNLVYHGAFDRSTPLHNVYGSLDAVVLPSVHVEGSPLCLIEAMAYGKPWIAFDRGGIKDLVADRDYCLVPESSDFAGFRSAIKVLSDRIRHLSEPCESLVRYYTAHYSPRAVGAKWDALLEAMRRRP